MCSVIVEEKREKKKEKEKKISSVPFQSKEGPIEKETSV